MDTRSRITFDSFHLWYHRQNVLSFIIRLVFAAVIVVVVIVDVDIVVAAKEVTQSTVSAYTTRIKVFL